MNPSNIYVFCGPDWFVWDQVMKNFRDLWYLDNDGRLDNIPHAAAIMDSPTRLLFDAKGKGYGEDIIDLERLLLSFPDLQSTNVRDKIFGLLSLASNDAQEIVDYSLSPSEVVLAVYEVSTGAREETNWGKKPPVSQLRAKVIHSSRVAYRLRLVLPRCSPCRRYTSPQ